MFIPINSDITLMRSKAILNVVLSHWMLNRTHKVVIYMFTRGIKMAKNCFSLGSLKF